VAERTRALNRACTFCCGTSSLTALRRVSRRRLPQSFCAALVPAMPRDGRESGWPPSWCAMCAPSIGRLPLFG
jgi:hypothetical protein